MALCKVYSDGNAWIGTYVCPNASLRPKKERKRRALTDLDQDFRVLYQLALASGLYGKKSIKGFVLDNLRDKWGDLPELAAWVEMEIDREYRNFLKRKKRFNRKAFFNRWNYFCTFTYDSTLMDEDTFRKKLRKCLSNLHTRRGWNYMGVWERGEKGNRLHFHALVYIPEGEMIGGLFEQEYYDKKTHSRKKAVRNTFFDARFGRSDFKRLTAEELRHGGVMDYLLKYMQKTGERIVYSRGIEMEEIVELSEDRIAFEYLDYVAKVMLFDNDAHFSKRIMMDEQTEKQFYFRC